MSEKVWETLPVRFRKSVQTWGDKAAFREKKNGKWVATSFKDLKIRAQRIARFLLSRGIEPGERVVLVSNNRTEWPVIEMGIQTATAASVPIYPSTAPDTILHILENCEAKIAFLEDKKQLEKFREVRPEASFLKEVVVLDADGLDLKDQELRLADVESEFSDKKEHDEAIEARIEALTEDDLASIVYTSGTTGMPKGVMLLHKNFSHNVTAAQALISISDKDHHLSFLPLSHVFERTAGYYLPVMTGATVHFAESQEKIRDNLAEINPSFMTSVPRLYEKIRAAAQAKARNKGGLTHSIFQWAEEVGKLRAAAIQGKRTLGLLDKLTLWIADSLVFSKVRAIFGTRLRFFVSGGAPLSPELGEWFLGAGIKVLEGYGLTETAPLLTANSPDLIRMGTVGRVVQDVEIKIAEDGEICARGPNIMKGYFKNPEATAEVLDSEGWFHTGDIGEFTKDKCLRITDRKKNLLVLSNGKNVAPAPIENCLINSLLINQAVVLGDNRKFVSALLVPDFEALEKVAKDELGLGGKSRAELLKDEKVMQRFLEEVKKTCDDFSPYEQPKKVALLEEEFSQEKGELTPTLKVKRKIVLANYSDSIEALYA